MLLIGFGHKARQGKNSAALAVLNAMPIGCHARIYAYADALRAEVKRASAQMGCAENLINAMKDAGIMPDWVVPELGKPRTLLQWWGTDYRRSKDPNYWVKRLQDTFDREQPEAALVTDVRFPNEADAIHAAGGYLVKVTRTTAPDIDVPAHPSEQAMDGYAGWDYEIVAADLPSLRKQAETIYREIVKQHG